jgi:hypothetical protein
VNLSIIRDVGGGKSLPLVAHPDVIVRRAISPPSDLTKIRSRLCC